MMDEAGATREGESWSSLRKLALGFKIIGGMAARCDDSLGLLPNYLHLQGITHVDTFEGRILT